MQDKEFVSFLDHVEGLVVELSPKSAVVFGLACAERMWRVHLRATDGSDGDGPMRLFLRDSIDLAWDYALKLEDTGWPKLSSGRCRECVPKGISSPQDAIVFHNANAIADFLESIEEGNPHYAHYVSARVLELLEVLFGEVVLDEERQDGLYKAEMNRQLDDLNTLIGSGDNLHALREVKARSVAIDIFGGHWFD